MYANECFVFPAVTKKKIKVLYGAIGVTVKQQGSAGEAAGESGPRSSRPLSCVETGQGEMALNLKRVNLDWI